MLVLLCACTHPPRQAANNTANSVAIGYWEGRLTLRVAKNPPEQFSTAFEMSGHAEQGQLHLLSPLGTTLAVVRWSPQGASLQQSSDIQQFASMDELTQGLTGAALPLPQLLIWLDREGPAVAGWQINADVLKKGRRVLAERQQPLPALLLTLLLDPPS
ncbi:MAG: outer membrane lipoprotein LolB [Burkholderiales bacterium]|jgi:outer membrane lipoprotein LolB|nr:outer membrane lipoprotein LolB [Burkholderiales bacterium]